MSGIEQRYRRALRWYPSRWRAANEEVILGTLLDGAAGRDKPRFTEVVNLALNGLLARFGWMENVVPTGARDRASGVALGFAFGVTVVMLVMQEWAPWATPVDWATQPASEIGPFHGWGGVLYSAWSLGFVLAVCGWSTAARWVIAATIPFSIALMPLFAWSMWLRPPNLALAILVLLAVVVVGGNPLRSKISYVPLLGSAVFGASWILVPLLRNVETTSLIPSFSIWNLGFQSGEPSGTLGVYILVIGGIAILTRRWLWAGAMMLLGLAWLAIAILYLPTEGVILSVAAVVVALAAFTWIRASGYRLALVRRE